MIGDVVQHFVNGKAHHTMIITALAPSIPNTPATPGLNGIVLLASYHSKDKLNVPLTLLSPKDGENLFWQIFDHVPDTNSGVNILGNLTYEELSHYKASKFDWLFSPFESKD